MYQYVLVCTGMHLYVLVGTKINNYVLISVVESVPSDTSSYLESCTPEWTSTKALFCLVQLGTGLFRCTGFKGTSWYWDRSKLRQLVQRRVQGSTWQYQTEHDSTKWCEIVIYGMNWYVAVQTSMYQCVQVNWQTMFLIDWCMYWFVLVCTDSYHYVKLTHQYVQVCILLFWYKQVCSWIY